jgi:hypothetical protein
MRQFAGLEQDHQIGAACKGFPNTRFVADKSESVVE